MVNLELSHEDIFFIISTLERRQTAESLNCEHAVDVGNLNVLLDTQKNIEKIISLNNRLCSFLIDDYFK